MGSTSPAWETENMLYPRVMGDAVHLPDGTLFICNGGQVGKPFALFPSRHCNADLITVVLTL